MRMELKDGMSTFKLHYRPWTSTWQSGKENWQNRQLCTRKMYVNPFIYVHYSQVPGNVEKVNQPYRKLMYENGTILVPGNEEKKVRKLHNYEKDVCMVEVE